MGKAYRVRLAESSLERAARMLTDDYAVKVAFKGDYAFTHEGTIVMPSVPADATDEYVEVMTGMLFHEAGHKLFTDYSDHPDVKQDRSRFACINTIEDVRIEAKIKKRFPGAHSALGAFHDVSASILQKNWAQSTQLQRVLNGLVFTLSDGKTGFYEAIDPVTRRWVDQALEFTQNATELETTNDSVDLGSRLADFLEPLFEDHEQKAQSSQKMQDQTSYGLDEQTELSKELADEIQESDDGESGESKEGALETELKQLRGDGTYRIYSTEEDQVEYIDAPDMVRLGKDTVVDPGALVQALRDSTSDAVVTMRRKLLNTLRILTESKWSRGHEEGELDQDVLYEIPHRLNDYVFKQKLKNMELDVALALAIDHSGSMGTEKMTLATQCAITLGDVLQPLKIPFLVYGFSTSPATFTPPADVAKNYARWNALWLGVYQDFNDNWREGSLRVATALTRRRQNTLDGESVLWGMRRLLARKEKRKILFVLTDGQPQPGAGVQARCSDHLLAVTALAPQVGVEVIAFGIQSRTVEVYYPHHVVLHTLGDIVREPLTKLDDALRKGRRFR